MRIGEAVGLVATVCLVERLQDTTRQGDGQNIGRGAEGCGRDEERCGECGVGEGAEQPGAGGVLRRAARGAPADCWRTVRARARPREQ